MRKLIQKRHLEGAEQNQVLGPTNLGSVLLASDTRTLKCRVFMNGIWRVYWAVPLAWESHSFIPMFVESNRYCKKKYQILGILCDC